MAGKAKENRDEWELKLITAVEELGVTAGAATVNKRAVEVKIKNVESVFEGLQRAHVIYCQKAKMGLGASESTEFIKNQIKLKMRGVSEAREAAGIIQEDFEGEQLESKMKNKQFMLKADLEGRLTSLESLSSTTLITQEQLSSITDMLEECTDNLNKYMECVGADQTEPKQISEIQEFYKNSSSKISKLKCEFLAKAPIKSNVSPPSLNSTAGVTAVKVEGIKAKQPVKIKDMDCPTWDGRYRTFPRFKKMWDENITPRYEDTALHYLLCQALPKTVLENISTLSDSAEDIWHYLDERFGKPDIVAREVMNELFALDHRKLGSKFMVKFTTLLLDTESLLKSINEEEWLISNRTVAELEDKLPQAERVEWARLMSSTVGDSKYERFKNFLQARKQILDNMDTIGCRSLTVGNSEKCGYCSKSGHAEDICYSKKRDQKKSKGACAICHESDHWKNECPLKGSSRDNKPGGRSGNKLKRSLNQNSASADGTVYEVGSNTLRALDCQRCKTSNKLNHCPGCKKSSHITHCLLHCEGFMVLSVKDRVDIVKSAKHCAVCLHPSHTTDKCYNKEKDTHLCGVNGCASHHHPSLHGSNDLFVTGVNALLRQREVEFTTAGLSDLIDVDDWLSRRQFIEDSHTEDKSRNVVNILKSKRDMEIEEVKAELQKPLINGDKVLMCVMTLSLVSGEQGAKSEVTGFFDDGSNCSCIKNSTAERLGLWGHPITLELGTVNATTSIETKLYCVELLDRHGHRHLIKAFGLESLSGPLPSINLEGIQNEFSGDIQQHWGDFARPIGEIELLIGSEVANLHPQHFETVGGLVVKQSVFGTGWVLNGAHQGIICSPVEISRQLQIIRTGCFRSNRIVASFKQDYMSRIVDTGDLSEKEFFAAESLGCEAPRRCQGCRNCSDCGFRASSMSQKEYLELKQMEESISFDSRVGKWRVNYAFNQDPRILRNNYRRVLRMSESTERRLIKLGKMLEANALFKKMVDIGALEEVSACELSMWNGPVHYLPIQAVMKDTSITTPLRLVTNSSLLDPETGFSLNSILISGPCCLNDMWEMMVRFRHHELGLCGDISKAYYQMRTGPLEKHIRRVLWREGKIGTPWRIYGFTVVSMGDKPAANFMELTKRNTARMACSIDEVAARRIETDSFVDDVSTGGTREECQRFKGSECPGSLQCDGTIPQILGKGGFSLKAMVLSGEPDGLALHTLGAAVLGLGFSTGTDMLSVKFKVNVSLHIRGKPTEEDLTVETLHKLQVATITKRTCLRVVSSQYDPLGIASCLMVKLKVQLKELYKLGLDWDTPLEGNLRESWVQLFSMLVQCGEIQFIRSTKPEGYTGSSTLVCYFDGSDIAFGFVIYIRWEMEDGSIWTNFVASKTRVTPQFGTSTPRIELEGATLVSRVVVRIVHALLEDPPTRIIFLGDSETVLACRERDKGFFGEFYGNRIGEQHDNATRVHNMASNIDMEWYHVSSDDNAADVVTRMRSLPSDLSLQGAWLSGPSYLKLPIQQWPIDRNFAERKKVSHFPADELRRQYRDQIISDVADQIVMKNETCIDAVGPGNALNPVLKQLCHGSTTNDWMKLVRKTSYLFLWYAKVLSDHSISVHLSKELAVMFWIRAAMPATNHAAAEGKLRHLDPKAHPRYPDVLVVIGRASQGFQSLFHNGFLPILMASTRTAWLIMMWAHSQDHAGVDTTFQTSLQYAWIVGGRVLARSIKKSCVRCRFLHRKTLDQKMAGLPSHLGIPAPPFSYVAVDLAGPFLCKREGGSKFTRKNTGTIKVWAVLVVCLQVKAVKIYMVGGLHTEDFLLAWDSFVADHGQPLIAYSDRGTNLVAASKEQQDVDVPSYDWSRIASSSKGLTEWKFHPPGSQFRNGAVEIFVKKFKRTLQHRFGDKLMFMLELQASFKIVSSILNSRPLYARWGSHGTGDTDHLIALTPNMMLTGRANVELPIRDYASSDRPLLRIQYVEECVSQWWNQFQLQHFSSLVPRQKWLFERRNMAVGDVVLLMYEGKSKPGSYRLAIVREVELSSDGLVRTVVVEYSLVGELPYKERDQYKNVTKKKILVPVQRLVMILPIEEQDVLGERAGEPAPLKEVIRDNGLGVEGCSGDVGTQGCFGTVGRWNFALEVRSSWKLVRMLDQMSSYEDVDGRAYSSFAQKFLWNEVER